MEEESTQEWDGLPDFDNGIAVKIAKIVCDYDNQLRGCDNIENIEDQLWVQL